MRVVSMLPSATEIVYALGLDDDLVGVTFECNEPLRARREKRIVVGGRDTSAMTASEIDRYVREQLGALAELAPEVILTQDLCRVCALPTDHLDDALDYLGCRAEVISLDPHTLDDVLAVAQFTERLRSPDLSPWRERASGCLPIPCGTEQRSPRVRSPAESWPGGSCRRTREVRGARCSF